MYIIEFRMYIFNIDCSKTYLKLDNSSACSFSWTPKISFVEFVESFIPRWRLRQLVTTKLFAQDSSFHAEFNLIENLARRETSGRNAGNEKSGRTTWRTRKISPKIALSLTDFYAGN